MKLFNNSHKMVRDTGLWGFWSHHHLLLLPGHSSLFSGFRVRGVVAASPQIIYGATPEDGIQVTGHQSLEAPNAIKLRKSLAT